jgi:hypothetical protein
MNGSRLLRSLVALSAMAGVLHCAAQATEHPFMKSFDLVVMDGRIQVAWTMQGGSTCDGIEVQRSTNGVDFTTIHRIDGICGDPVFDVPFGYRDDAPPELSRLHYRIDLGIEGLSSVKTVDFAQLTEARQRFFPSPMRNSATLLLNVSGSARVDLRLFDASGRQVWQHSGLVGRQHELELGFLQAGVYLYVADADGKRFQGRFVKE